MRRLLARHRPSSTTRSLAMALIAWAGQLGMEDAVRRLEQTLEQEYNADRLLTDLAEGSLNRQAA